MQVKVKDIQDAIYCMKVTADQTVCEECDYYPNCDHTTQEDMARVAISALEKQVPKKIIHDPTRPNYCTCPSCNRSLDKFAICGDDVKRIMHDFCHFCGQAIDWSE